MARSVYSREYTVFLQCLRQVREEAGLTQRDVAARLERSQSFVAKCEQGHNRVDVAQLVEFCRALGVPLPDFIRRYDEALKASSLSQTRREESG